MHRMQRKNIFGLKANNFVFIILFFEINIPYFFLLNYLGIMSRVMDSGSSLGLA
jgi:hypothetical protein